MRKTWVFHTLSLLLVAILGVAWASTATRPNKIFGGTEWLTGQSVTADDLNADVNTLYSHINGANISDANIDATGITTKTKLPAITAFEDEANVFTADQTISKDAPTLILTDTGESTPAGRFQIFSNNDKVYIWRNTTGNIVIWDNAGVMELGTIPNARLGGNTACTANYTFVNGWCMDTDGSNTIVRGTLSADAAYVDVVIHASAKLAMIHTYAFTESDGTQDGQVIACTRPGDESGTTCDGTTNPTVAREDAVSGEFTSDSALVIVRLDSSGRVATRCFSSGSLTTIQCNWYLQGYMP